MSTQNSWPGFERVGHRITGGPSRQGSSPRCRLRKGARREFDDAPRLAFVEVLADEQKEDDRWDSWPVPSAGSLSRGSPWSADPLRDNAPLTASGDWRKAVAPLDSQCPSAHKPYTPQNNGGRPTVHQNHPGGMGLRDRLQTSDERKRWLTPAIWGSITQQVPHGSRCLTPQQCLQRLADRLNDLGEKHI